MPPIAIAARGADRARVGGHGHDHEHQERGEDQLVDERAAGGDARHGRAEVGRLVGQTASSTSAATVAPRSWAPMYASGLARREVAGQREGDRHGGVDVRAERWPVA